MVSWGSGWGGFGRVGGGNVTSVRDKTNLVKRQNERQMMKLKILLLGFPACTCIALFHISCHCITQCKTKSVHFLTSTMLAFSD